MQLRYAELFAGLGLGSLAIKRVFPDAKCAFYSEIEKNRVELLKKHHPGVKNIGDIDFLDAESVPAFDLLVGGSPCQNLSIANTNTREGLDGHESGLFYQYLELLRVKKPKWFLLENVASMSKDDRDEISRCLGVQPVEINSLYFTGQIRKRLYWCNWPMLPLPTEPIDPRWCIDQSVMPDKPTSEFIKVEELYSAYTPKGKMKNPKALAKGNSDWDFVAWSRSTRYKEFEGIKNKPKFEEFKKEHPVFKFLVEKDFYVKVSHVEQRIKVNMQANTLLTGKGCSIFSSRNFIRHKTKMRILTPLECARLQGIPDGHLDGWSDGAAYAAIGDAFTLPVIEFIFSSLKAHLESN
jgi:DNA-cytosine methyltransferase